VRTTSYKMLIDVIAYGSCLDNEWKSAYQFPEMIW
jgi:hypothetical protein